MGSLHTLNGSLCRFRRFRKGANGLFHSRLSWIHQLFMIP